MDSQEEALPNALPLNNHYLKMTPSQIAERLSKRKLPIAELTDTLELYRREKPKINSANVKARQRRRLWREFTMPLKAEIKNVKVMLHNYMGEARHEALSWYLVQLEALHAKMMRHADAGLHTPAKLVKGSATILNDGTHWTDWVPMSKRHEVYELFKAIPKGARVKVPFERRIPKTLGVKLRDRLLARTLKEYEGARRKLKMLRVVNVDFEKIASMERDIQRMAQAIEWIKEMKDADAVPTTWHGFFKSSAMKLKGDDL
jgi:hypothetical protein